MPTKFWHHKIYFQEIFNQIIHNVFLESKAELSAFIMVSLEDFMDLSLNH